MKKGYKYKKGGKIDLRSAEQKQEDLIKELNAISPEKLRYIESQKNQGTIGQAARRRSTLDKAGAIARNPITAAQYKLQGKDIPDYLEKGATNSYDRALDVFNPLTYYDAGKRVITGEHYKNAKSVEDYINATAFTALDAGMAFSVGKGALKNLPTEIKNPLGNKFVINSEEAAKWANPGKTAAGAPRFANRSGMSKIWKEVPRDPIKIPQIFPKSYQRVPGKNYSGMVLEEGQMDPLVVEPKGTITNSAEIENKIQGLHADNANTRLHNATTRSYQRIINPLLGYDLQEINNARYIPGMNTFQQQYIPTQRGVDHYVPLYTGNTTEKVITPTPNKVKAPSGKKKEIPVQDTVYTTPQYIEPKRKYQFVRSDEKGIRESDRMDQPIEPEWFNPNKQYGGSINNKYANGGIAKNQWDTPYTPGAPGMTDYGDMYSAGNNQGLMFKPRDMNAGWEGYGNPANLITNTQNTDNMYKGTKRQLPSRQLAMDPSEYSIDAVRGQYGNGGFTQKKGMYWDGTSMKKAKPGAYDTMWEHGGEFVSTPVPQKMDRYGINLYQQGGQFTQVPVPQHMDRYGLNLYQKGGFVDVPLPQKMDRYGLNLYGDGGIHIKPENRGKFTAYKERTGKTTEEALHSSDPHVRQMANFARNAAKWKHQYGGPTRYDTGGVTPEEPIAGAVTLNGTPAMPANTWVDNTNSYNPATDPNNPVNQNLPMPLQGGYAAAQPGTWDTTGITDTQQVIPTPRQPRRPIGQGYRDILGAAMIYGNYAANNRQNKNLQAYQVQQGMTSMNPTQTPFNKGVYNQQGQITGQAQYGGKMNMGGKCYEAGGQYEMDDNEIEMLRKKGYTYKMI